MPRPRQWLREPKGARRARKAGKKGVRLCIRAVYIPPLDESVKLFLMKQQKSAPSPQQLQATYAQLRQSLSAVGWISQGYVQDRGPGAGGPCYQWTRKVKGKTVSLALSKEQFLWLQQAINNWRSLQDTIQQMQRISREILFTTLPHPPRRKRLSKKVMGII